VLRQTLQYLVVAAISGALTSMADYLNGGHQDFNHIWKPALTGAIIGMAGYWTRSPREKKEEKESKDVS
jgi:hypothetical protein